MKRIILRWTKRAFIAIFVLAAILVTGFSTFILLERHRLAQFNRTYEKPLRLEGNALHLMNELETPQSDNSLRFIVMPSFGKRWFAVAVEAKGGSGIGEVIVQPVAQTAVIDGVGIIEPLNSGIVHRRFAIPLADLQRLFSRWDDLTDGYSGEARAWADGARLSFERKQKGHITSGSGNSPCHYDVLGDWAAQRLSRYAPELYELRAPWLEKSLKSDSCNQSIFSLR